MTILFSGIALVLNSVMVLLSVAVAVLVTQIGVVRREERYLAARFGNAYHQYRTRVRPWI